MSSNEINPFSKKAYSENYYVLRKTAKNLPVSQQVPRLLSALKNHNVMIVVGETGSGKTTQLPKEILLADTEIINPQGKKVVLTQNRRLAAELVATRIAAEMDVPLGSAVGLRHRGRDSTIDGTTRLEVATDGSLLALAKSDPNLSAYGVIVIDEAHQHSVSTDLLLGLLKDLAVSRKNDLKIVIISTATDAALFTDFFPGSVLETVSGREHKVLVSYLAKGVSDRIGTIVNIILQVHLTQRMGNILVFVSGTHEISMIISRVEAALTGPRARFGPSEMGPLACWPLHAKLSPEEEYNAVYSPPPATGRKVIVATNIAETSITLTGVTHVIDSCRVKSKVWDPESESWCLRELWISKAVAQQRAGRAGRTREGMAWRMCTQVGYEERLTEHSVPDICNSDMLSECLHVLKLGRSPIDYPFIVAPASETIVKAFGILLHLGAVDLRGSLTPLGDSITSLPVNVYSAMVLLSSPQFGCSDDMMSLISMMEASENGNHIFIPPQTTAERIQLARIKRKFRHPCSDHLSLFNIYMSWRAASLDGTADKFVADNKLHGSMLRSADGIREQLRKLLIKQKGWRLKRTDPAHKSYYINMIKALTMGNFLRVAKRESPLSPREYQTVRHGKTVMLSPGTDLGPPTSHNEWIIYNELYHKDSGNDELRLVSAIPLELIISTTPNYWLDVEFLPKGHIQDSVVNVLASMTGKSVDFIRSGGMPAPPAPDVST